MAEASACLITPGLTDVNFMGDQYHTIELAHINHKDVPSMTRFSMNGKVYYWKGHSELVSVETGDLLAEFFPSWLVIDVHEHKLGKLVIKGEGKKVIDAVVVTALITHERSDEGRQAVLPHHRHL